jgi:hypothetical protein
MRVPATESSSVALPAMQPPAASIAIASPVSSPEESSPFARVLRGLSREINDGEASTRSALGSLQRGADFGPSQLIALQVGVYRYSEAIDLASRLVDRATNGVKTVVQGGGQ